MKGAYVISMQFLKLGQKEKKKRRKSLFYCSASSFSIIQLLI